MIKTHKQIKNALAVSKQVFEFFHNLNTADVEMQDNMKKIFKLAIYACEVASGTLDEFDPSGDRKFSF